MYLKLLNRPALFPLYWVLLSLLVSAIDFQLGPYIQFPIVYLIPVGLAAWYSGWRWGVSLAVLLPLGRLYFVSVWNVPWGFEYSVANAVIRIVVLGGLAILLNAVAGQRRELAQRVRVLEGMLPVCSSCKKIRDESNVWQPMERYISERSKATFTHGLCPICATKYFGEFAAEP